MDERGWRLLGVAYQSDEPVLQALVSDITTALHAIVNVQVKELCWQINSLRNRRQETKEKQN